MLPQPPRGDRYLTELVRAVDRELAQRPRFVDGAIVISPTTPLEFTTPDGSRYRLSVNNSGGVETERVT